MREKFPGKITGKRLTPAQNLQPRRTLPSDMQKGTPCRRGRLHHGAVRFSHSFDQPNGVLSLVSAGHVVIAGGGGGIPTVCKDNWYKAIDAVIDKDYASVLLAADTGCDALAILTGVEKVSINFNTTDQQELDEISVSDAEKYIAEGQFPEGSMLPKIRAALRFTTSGPGRRTLITSLDKLVEGLDGQTGTWVVP